MGTCRFFSALLLGLWVACSTATLSAQQMHAFVVSDTSPWASWGEYLPNVQMDSTNVFAMLTNNVPERQLNLVPLSLSYNESSVPEAILAEVRQLRVGPLDTVLFYFTGHGGNDDRGQYLHLAGGRLYRDELRETLQRSGAKLVVLLTDCCNLRGDGEQFFAPAPLLEPPARVTPLFQSLFFEPTGVVDINSSSPGEAAFFTPPDPQMSELPGSLFTKELVKFADRFQDQRSSWEHLLRSVSLNVHLAFRQAYPHGAAPAKGAPRQTDQNVYAYEYPGMPEQQGPRTGVVVRDNQNQGAMVIRVEPASPATKVYDLRARRYTRLEPGQVIVKANGQVIRSAADMMAITRQSPQVMRLTVRDARGFPRELLMRLRY